MYQTFYIDADEEVNSIVGRIRKSSAKYNILAIPQGALVMQSAVSLKLIRKEVEALEKKAMLITKDERAAAIARKIGFPVRNSLDELKGIPRSNDASREGVKMNVEYQTGSQDNNSLRSAQNFAPSASPVSQENNAKNLKENYEAPSRMPSNANYQINHPQNISNEARNVRVVDNTNENFNVDKDREFRDLFAGNSNNANLNNQPAKKVSTGGVIKFLWFFIFTIAVLGLGMAAYFYLPKAEVAVYPKGDDQTFNLELNAIKNPPSSGEGVNLQSEKIESENVLALSFAATGQKGSSDQKAKGKIIIYNEFSETSQVLVATTRFVTEGEDEKIFRLINTVTVPGMSVKDGHNEPGTVEAEIIADEAGEDYNISEANFKIPGFKGSPKYDKFYAKLKEEIRGGGGTTSELKTVSASDIASAKKETENQLKEQLKNELQTKAGDKNILLDDAISYEVVDYSVFPEQDSVTENFEYQVKIKAKALVFSSDELENSIDEFAKSKMSQNGIELKPVSIEKDYRNVEVDFENNSLKADLNLQIKAQAEIDTQKLADYLAGKNRDEVNDALKEFPEIEKLEAVIKPSYIASSFPRKSSRIKITLENFE